MNKYCSVETEFFKKSIIYVTQGRVQDFSKGGSNIFWFPKKGHQILKGGVQWSDGGGVQYISLPRTTNLAYLDAKE